MSFTPDFTPNFTPEEHLLAFRLYVVDMVVAADEVTSDAEAEFLDRAFPAHELERAGFVDAAGVRTERFHDAAVDALAALPRALDKKELLALLAQCWDAVVADGHAAPAEASTILMAARLLGIADADFDTWLRARPDAAGLTLAALDAFE